MSDTPPDRKEADDAPAAPKNPWVGWLMWAILVPVLYVLSVGPVYWLALRGYLPGQIVVIYAPLNYLSGEPARLISAYIKWWNP